MTFAEGGAPLPRSAPGDPAPVDDPSYADAGTPADGAMDVEHAPALRRLWAGVVAWIIVCAVYLGLEHANLVDGLAMPVPLILALVLARVVDERPRVRRVAYRLAAVLAVASVPLAVLAWRAQLALPGASAATVAVGLVAGGGTIALALSRRVRRALARPLGLRPGSAVHVVSLVAAVLAIATSVVMFRELQVESDDTVPFYFSDSLVSLLSDATLALAGIGFMVTRGVRAARNRLGLRAITIRQVVVAALIAAAFLAIVGAMEHLESVWLPQVNALEDRFDYEFVGMPEWLGAILLSLGAGIGEELVFRGALQPRFGVIFTSVVFAAVHVQYQVPGIFMIFVVALGLGLVKERTSTTFTVCVHFIYDLGTFFVP